MSERLLSLDVVYRILETTGFAEHYDCDESCTDRYFEREAADDLLAAIVGVERE